MEREPGSGYKDGAGMDPAVRQSVSMNFDYTGGPIDRSYSEFFVVTSVRFPVPEIAEMTLPGPELECSF
jgi:hypothetical protein